MDKLRIVRIHRTRNEMELNTFNVWEWNAVISSTYVDYVHTSDYDRVHKTALRTRTLGTQSYLGINNTSVYFISSIR